MVSMINKKMIVPIGRMPELDKDLERIINKLPKNASIKNFCKEVDRWETLAISKFKDAEQKMKSCKLDPLQ